MSSFDTGDANVPKNIIIFINIYSGCKELFSSYILVILSSFLRVRFHLWWHMEVLRHQFFLLWGKQVDIGGKGTKLGIGAFWNFSFTFFICVILPWVFFIRTKLAKHFSFRCFSISSWQILGQVQLVWSFP